MADRPALFSPDERGRLRSALLEYAAQDPRITAGALTGSAAAGREDRWSDIDLAFGVADGVEVAEVVSGWTAHLYERHGAVHHHDVRAGAWVYRVFLLASTLQVDLAFVPSTDFRALGPTFLLQFGKANEPRHWGPPAAADLVGMGWLYALHARSSIARGKPWQAEYMLSGMRNHALALASIRHGLPADHGRGFDQLPGDLALRLEDSLVRQLDRVELTRAFRVVIEALLNEIQWVDAGLAARLQGPLRGLAEMDG